MSTATRKLTIREQMHAEDLEQQKELRAGHASRNRDYWAGRWTPVVREHETWLGHLDAIDTGVRRDLAAIEKLLTEQRTQAEANGRRPNESEVLALGVVEQSAYRWRLRQIELEDCLRDLEEGFTPLRSGETIERFRDRNVRPRWGELTVFASRFGRVRTRALLEEARAELARLAG